MSSSTRLDRRSRLLEHGRRAAARDELDAELGEAAREGVEPGLVVDGDERAADHCGRVRAPRTTAAAAGARPPGSARLQRVGVVVAAHGTGSGGDHGAGVDALVDEWTVTPRSRVRRPRARPRPRAAPGKAGSSAGWMFTIAPGKRSRKRRAQQVHVAGEDDEVDAVGVQPVRHRLVARLAVGVVVELESGGRDPGRRGRARARARPRGCEPTATIGRPASISAWRFVPLAADEDADHTEPPDRGQPADGAGVVRHDRAHADAEVEDASLLLLLDALLAEPVEDGPALPGVPVESAPTPVGQHAREVAEDAAAGDVRERLHVGARAQRAHLVEVEPVRREQQVGVEVVLADERADEREAVRVQTGGGEAEDDVAGRAARAVDELGRGRRCRRTCRRSRARPRGRLRAARRSRRRSARSRRRGTPPRRPRRARPPAPARSGARRRSRAGRAARRPVHEHVVDAVGGEIGAARRAGAPRAAR